MPPILPEIVKVRRRACTTSAALALNKHAGQNAPELSRTGAISTPRAHGECATICQQEFMPLTYDWAFVQTLKSTNFSRGTAMLILSMLARMVIRSACCTVVKPSCYAAVKSHMQRRDIASSARRKISPGQRTTTIVRGSYRVWYPCRHAP